MLLSVSLLLFTINLLCDAKPHSNFKKTIQNISPVHSLGVQPSNTHRESRIGNSFRDNKWIQNKSAVVRTAASTIHNTTNGNNNHVHHLQNGCSVSFHSCQWKKHVYINSLQNTSFANCAATHGLKYVSRTQVGLEQYETLYVNSTSYSNSRTYVKRGKYIYKCLKSFTGSSCNIDIAVCYKPFGPNKRLPCSAHNKTCQPIPGGGYVCESNSIASRHISFTNMSLIIDCNDQDLCPSQWKCWKINKLKGNYCCKPLHDQLSHAYFHNSSIKTRYKRSIIEDLCEKNLCQHGSKCKRNKCICLMHYMGKFCDKEINYCLSNPCKEGVRCEPRLGGYNCVCPSTHFGLQCDIPTRTSLQQMRRPNFIYSIHQYSGVEFEYYFYAKSIGDLPSVLIDFGDNSQQSADEKNFTQINNIKVKHLRQFPNLYFYDDDLQSLYFTHIYKTPGLYNLTIKATAMKHLVFLSTYPVRVDLPSSCTMTVKLRNCVKSVGANITEYTREDHIVILSDVKVNCFHSRLKFVWSLHNAFSKFDKPTEQNQLYIKPKVDTNQPYLNIYPYTLPFGIYIAQLNVTMDSPNSNLLDHTYTWFQIKEMEIVARLLQGKHQQIRWRDSFVLNASLSYNPNMPPDDQGKLNFIWTCTANKSMTTKQEHEKDTFCPITQDIALPVTGPILRVPPKRLLLHWSYTFYLSVSVASTEHNLTPATTYVVVEVKPDTTPIMTIKCVRNCENNKINIGDTMVFEAVCLTCTNGISNDLSFIEWKLFNLDSQVDKKPAYLNLLGTNKFGYQSSTLILNKETFLGHTNFILSLTSIADERNNTYFNIKDLSSTIQRNIHVPSPIETGYCIISPQSGFSIITDFHIFCYNFKGAHAPFMYEVTQFRNYSSNSKAFAGTLVGYEMESEIHDIKLEAGFPDYDHVTLIRVIVSSRYINTFYNLNVTVFPQMYLGQTPHQVLSYFAHQIADEHSLFGKTRNTQNVFTQIQIIKIIAESTSDLLESYYVSYIDLADITKTVEYIRNNLVYYLGQQEILDLEGLKHFATALSAILKLPHYSISSPSTKIGVKLFKKIIETMSFLKRKHSKVDKVNVEDLAPQMMSVASNLLKMPHDLHDSKFHHKILGTGKDDEQDKTMTLEVLNKNYVEFANLTTTVLQNLFSYGFHIIPYKANKEESMLYQSESLDMKLIVQKNSPYALQQGGLFIHDYVSTVPLFLKEHLNYTKSFFVFLLYMKNNPFWWHPRAEEISSPLMQLQIYEEDTSKPVKVPIKVMIHTAEHVDHKTVEGQLKIQPYWTLSDHDIHVNQIQVPKGGKVILQFVPIRDDHKIQVVVKKGFRPEIVDFWNAAITVPQKLTKKGPITTESYTVYVDEESTSDQDFYYIGILPHLDTVQTLLDRDTTHNVNTKLVHSVDHKPNDRAYKITIKDENEIARELYHPQAMNIHDPVNNTLPFEYAAYSVRCLSPNVTNDNWASDCQVQPATTTETIFCKCTDFDMVTTSFKNVLRDNTIMRNINFQFTVNENPLKFYLIFFIIILFTVWLLWARWQDLKDSRYKDITFLPDNDPIHSYVYLIIVQTGRRPRAGTSSNVAMQLIGENEKSTVHILRSQQHPVLLRGQQDWFVLKTESSLGNICWINMWHDHLEPNPHWYCSKVIIQDIQSNKVWFFFAEQWFAPLYGDGSMSYSIYATNPDQVFKKSYQFKDVFSKGLRDGLHGWFGPFYKNQYSRYTRCQRVLMNIVHLLIMLLIIILFFDYPNSTGQHIINGIWTALIAFPFHLVLALAFIYVEPQPLWWNTLRHLHQFLTIDKPHEGQNTKKHAQMTFDLLGDRYYPVTYSVDKSVPPEQCIYQQPALAHVNTDSQQEFCLPAWCKYILWLILSIFAVVTLFYLLLMWVASSNTSYYVVFTTLAAVAFSMFVLELGKVVIYAIYRTIKSSKRITLEDRSKLVEYLNNEHTVAPALIPSTLKMLSNLREQEAYKTIPEKRVNILRQNAIRETSVRSMIADIGIILLIIFLITITIHAITDSLGFYNVQNVHHLIQGNKDYGKISLNDIVDQESLLHYINQSLIPNLYAETNYNDSPLKEKVQAKDYTNFLIGVPRLRQIRILKPACKRFKPNQEWAHRCKQDDWIEDTKEYDPFWKTIKHKQTSNRTESNTNPWAHQTWWETQTPTVIGAVSTYSGGGYVALLGRSQETSQKVLTTLMANDWFNNQTVAIFIEFSLYNPNRNLVSSVRILAENTIVGDYNMHSKVELVKVKPLEHVMPYILSTLFAVLIATIIICAYNDGFKVQRFRRWTYFANIWYLINIFLAAITAIVAYCLLKRTLLLSSSTEKLSNSNVQNYVEFNELLYWDYILIVTLSIMMFLIIMQTWHLLSVQHRFHMLTTVHQIANHSLICYFVMFVIFLCAFATAGHLVFISMTYQFRHYVASFTAMVGFSHRNFKYSSVTHTPHNSSFLEKNWGKCFFLTFFLMFFFIFRWGFVIILIERFRRLRVVVLQRKWLESVKAKFMQMNLAFRHNFGRKGFSRTEADTLVEEYIQASFLGSKGRLKAMERIVKDMEMDKKLHGTYNSTFMTRAKQLAMCALVIDHITAQMQYKRKIRELPNNKVGSTINSSYMKKKQAAIILTTYLKIEVLKQKLLQLNELFDNLMENN